MNVLIMIPDRRHAATSCSVFLDHRHVEPERVLDPPVRIVSALACRP